MKKIITFMLAVILIAASGICHAASYTLPEKMYNQLAIGSGLKGTFSVETQGEKFRTEFIDAISNAVFSIRGMISEGDLHYYVFQSDEKEQQSAVSELYRKNGVYYFRSDMVQGKTLVLPGLSQYLDSVFPSKGENGTSSSFISRIIELPEDEKKEKWEPVLTRYQNELEIWLADYTINAETIKLDNSFSALDFTYRIPADKLIEKIAVLMEEITNDPEASALLGSVMSAEEKNLFLNSNLMYFYQETLKSVTISEPVQMKRRVSAMGDLLSYTIELPMDENMTGFSSVKIEKTDLNTVYTVNKTNEIIIISVPDPAVFKKEQFNNQTVWYAYINKDESQKEKNNISIKAEITKTHNEYEKDSENHAVDLYTINIVQDSTYIPKEYIESIPEFEPVNASVELHYHSQYRQNSATVLQIEASVRSAQETDGTGENGSGLTFTGEIKTAKPWPFMPFNVEYAVNAGTGDDLTAYIDSWIRNAASVITKKKADNADSAESENIADGMEMNTETEDQTDAEIETETEEVSEEAETAPLDESEQE